MSAKGETDMATKKGRAMSQVYVSMAMSLDGFITGPHDDAQPGPHQRHAPHGLARGRRQRRERRRSVPTRRPQKPDRVRRVGHRRGDHRKADRGLRRLLGRRPPAACRFRSDHQAPAENPFEQVHYVTDGIAACVEQAKAPPATATSSCTAPNRPAGPQGRRARRHRDPVRPVLLGQGRRLFDDLPLSTSNWTCPRAPSARHPAPAL